MVALRTWLRGGIIAPFGLCTFVVALLPVSVGIQDLTALFSHQATAGQRQSALASPFETIHAATYSFPQPVGTAIPRQPGYRLANLDPKGHAALAPAFEPDETATPGLPSEDPVTGLPSEDDVWPEIGPAVLSEAHNPATDTARLNFGVDSMNAPLSALNWPAEDLEPPVPLPARRPPDADITLQVAAPASAKGGGKKAGPGTAGETVADTGEVTGKGKRPQSPAERLRLDTKARVNAEKCLAEAVYFESRGEAARGQIAVAQVVMNRVFSEFYPDNVCRVVYQNAHRRLACQFTFACDGIRDVVNDPPAWQRAKRIARDTLDGKLWLDDVGKATHYHAYWVRPWWIRTMRKLHKIGVHTFYRPRRWGDGSDEPIWGNAAATAEVVKTL
ncbi:MAG: cell wall hydrolase [Rhizobiales bacterium]|nr:cell wall hydrolase [Hyphomicrobiales bacterium]